MSTSDVLERIRTRTGRPFRLTGAKLKPAVCWAVVALYLALAVRYAWNPDSFSQGLAALGVVGAIAHTGLIYGWKNALVLLAICLTVTFTIENVGMATGVPFGRYHFAVGAGLPHVGNIPIIVGLLWFGMGYMSWIVAATLLGNTDRKLARAFNLFVLPLIASFVMTQWDLVMEPPVSTIAGAWVWHDGGAFFGVPLSNFLGWLLTSWLFFSGFAFYLRWSGVPECHPGKDRVLRAAAIVIYAGAGLTHLTPYLMGQSDSVTDVAGRSWSVADVREGTVAVLLLTMVFTAILAAIRLAETQRSNAV